MKKLIGSLFCLLLLIIVILVECRNDGIPVVLECTSCIKDGYNMLLFCTPNLADKCFDDIRPGSSAFQITTQEVDNVTWVKVDVGGKIGWLPSLQVNIYRQRYGLDK